MKDKTAEVIIIGGGLAGSSIAYHLAKLGCHDVIVLEKDTVGSGATAACGGGIRQQFSTEVNIKLSVQGLEFFRHFEEEIGCPIDLRQNGYLLMASTEGEWEALRQNVALQRKLGVEVYLLSPEEVLKIIPKVNIKRVIGATYCPTDGSADPYSVVQGFASAAKRLGAKIYEGVEVIDLKMVKGQEVRGVVTNCGELWAPIVVNAAGPYAKHIGEMAGINIPIRPTRTHAFFTEPTEAIGKDAPSFVIDVHNAFAIRREGQGLMFGRETPLDEPESLDTTVDWGCLVRAAEAGLQCFPFLEDIGIMRAQCGLYSNTPDGSSILSSVPEVRGLYLACGFSGHGFMHSPVVGKVMAECILGKGHSEALSHLTLDRFKGRGLKEEGVGTYR